MKRKQRLGKWVRTIRAYKLQTRIAPHAGTRSTRGSPLLRLMAIMLVMVCAGTFAGTMAWPGFYLSPSMIDAIVRWAKIQQLQEEMASRTDELERGLITESTRLKGTYQAEVASNSQPFFSTHYWGTSYAGEYSVPGGSYRGDGLVGLGETVGPQEGAVAGRFLTSGRFGQSSNGGGWSFEPGGALREYYSLLDFQSVVPGPPNTFQCTVVDRLDYARREASLQFTEKGIEQACTYTFAQQGATPESCMTFAETNCDSKRATQFWSTDGQIALDLSKRNTPVMRFPDGSAETFARGGAQGYVPINAGFLDMLPSMSLLDVWYPQQLADRNGNTTKYLYDGDSQKGFLTQVIDPRNRVTTYQRDAAGRVTGIVEPGPAGAQLTRTLLWSTFTWDPAVLFPDVTCVQNSSQAPCSQVSYTTLTSMVVPDGRQYIFSYDMPAPGTGQLVKGWGNLTRVTTPGGEVVDFVYGDQNTSIIDRAGTDLLVPQGSDNLTRRRLVKTVDYPNGLGGPPLTTLVDQQPSTLLTDQPADCPRLNWIVRTPPDGSVQKNGLCHDGRNIPNSSEGRVFTQVVKQNGTQLRVTHFGNDGSIGDNTIPVGNLYVLADSATAVVRGPVISLGPVMDMRPSKIVREADGLLWSEVFGYEDSNIPSSTAFRTTGNVAKHRVFDGSGIVLRIEQTSYFHPQAYLDRNILRLAQIATVTDPARGLLTRTDYAYDEFGLAPSSATNLIDPLIIGPARGNLTTKTSYGKPPAVGSPIDATNGAVSSETHYFDTGDVQQAKDPNHNPTTTGYDFGICSTGHTTLATTVTNAKGHQTTTVSDCFTGLALRVTDPNNQSVYTQYDNLGRVVETAGPGDTLTPIPGFTRDPNAPTNGGFAVGNNGQGPTAWIEYLSLGVINQQRTVTHTKDGTTDGRYVKTFVDGLGRTIQTRSELDPNFSQGFIENVATTEYDSMGRVSKSYVQCFSSASEAFTTSCTTLATTTQYDALGRVIIVTPPGLPASTTTYGNSGALFLATSIDANSNQTLTLTDVLGRTVQISRQSDTCPLTGNWCVTTMSHDAAGRLLQTTDPANNSVTFVYDGLGRKTSMTDPDMGRWTYDYDENGNLIRQTDANVQTILITYDVLNRITRKDLPPNGSAAGLEDTTYFYDGEGPAP